MANIRAIQLRMEYEIEIFHRRTGRINTEKDQALLSSQCLVDILVVRDIVPGDEPEEFLSGLIRG